LFDLLRYQIFNPPHDRRPHSDTATDTGTGDDLTPVTERRSLWAEEYGLATLSEQELKRLRTLSPLHAAASMTTTAQTLPPAVMLHAGEYSIV